MSKCPKCGGTSGYGFVMVSRQVMWGDWDGQTELIDTNDMSPSMAECGDCRAKFRMETVRKIADAAHQQANRRGDGLEND